ncbi:SCL-interrupting locus protein homolog [Clinocottus analis]|uniref:SCL-interrupting locus protein homolog n=1 Tax=Clinocottus analis TaxID=304258 RepID=UPI0035C152F4
MSCPVNLQDLPSGVFEAAFTPETVRGRTSSSLTALSFPKCRSALWDSRAAGETLRLQLCARRKPRLLLMEKALRLAQRHARYSNKPRLLSFLVGSVSVDGDEEGLTVTLDRFDPGRDPAGSCRVPSALLPGDVLVPCRFSTQTEPPSTQTEPPDAVVQSEEELYLCFKALQQCVSSRQVLHVSQLLQVRGLVVSQQSDAAAFVLRWSAVYPSVVVDVQPVRPVPVIPTALLRRLTGLQRGAPQRGFLTMDQTRKLLLLLESDPKASNLPLVGLWLSGVAHVSSPQVWAWCVRFLYSSALQDRVLSESRCFLLVLFASTHRAPQFFQGRGPEPGLGPHLDYQLLTGSQCVTLHQVASAEGRTLQCELGSEDRSRQAEVFREARTSFSRAARLSVSDQDSGVEDGDSSPRPSPSPHPPALQARRVQPSVPELSLLIDSSFTSNQTARQEPGSAHREPPPAPPTSTSSAPPPLHSTPNSNLQDPCCCCSRHTYDCTSIFSSPGLHPPSHHQTPPPPSHHQTPPPPSHHQTPPPPSHHQTPPPPSHHQTPPPPSHHQTPPPPSHHQTPPPPSHHQTPPPPSHHQTPLPPSHHQTPLPPSHHQTPLPPSHHQTPPPPSHHQTPPPPSHHQTPLPPSHHQTPLPPSHHQTPPPPSHHQTPPPPSHHQTPPPPSHHQTPLPPSHHQTPLPPSHHQTPLPPSHHQTPLPPSHHQTPPPPSHHQTPPPPSHHQTPLPPSHQTPSPCSTLATPSSRQHTSSPCSPHPPHSSSLLLHHLPAPWSGASSPRPPPRSSRPSCVNRCCGRVEGVVPSDTYQLLLHQDQQLRLLQAQVQMLLAAQGRLQSSGGQVTPRRTASIAVGTGASLFWGDPVQSPLPHQGAQAPPPSSPTTLSSHADLSVIGSVGGVDGSEAVCSSSAQHRCSVSGLESPVLGESASMYQAEGEQQSFYHNLMSQLTSRLQESDSQQEVESSRRSLSVSSQCSQSSKKQSAGGDPVLRATVKQLQQLGVQVEPAGLTESERRVQQTVQSSSTLASINPAAVLSRLSVTEPTASVLVPEGSVLVPEGSVDLSLEANAIALRYLSDSQLSRLCLGGPAPSRPGPAQNHSLLSPSNMSLATRKYMRRYGLIEEEEEEDEEEEEAEPARQPLTETLNVKLLPQSQLIRDLRPKMQLLAQGGADKENSSGRRPSLMRASGCQPEGSVGNILDLSRLRQLPKLF